MASKTRKRKKPQRATFFNSPYFSIVIGIIFISLAIYFTYLISRGANVYTTNLTAQFGAIGAFFYRGVRMLAGQCEYFVPLWLALMGLHFCVPKLRISRRMLVFFTIILVCLMALRHINIDVTMAVNRGMDGYGGGLIGALLTVLLVRSLSKVGAIIALIAIMVISLYIGSNGRVALLLQKCGQYISAIFTKGSGSAKKAIHSRKTIGNKKKHATKRIEETQQDADISSNKLAKKRKKSVAAEPVSSVSVSEEAHDTESYIDGVQEFNEEIMEDDSDKKLEEYVSSGRQIQSDESVTLKHAEYLLPGDDLLDPVEARLQADKAEIEQNVEIISNTLADFGVKGEINHVNVGPTLTQYEFKPAAGVRVTRIVNLADDLALSLATSGLRIEAPIPNKSAVGIEVPNRAPRTVRIREVIDSDAFQNAQSNISFALGKDISGHTIVADLYKMPHLLIAGATGSGKSVCLNALITSILFKAKPNEVKFIMVDPKKVELTDYANIPHLLAPVVTDSKKAAGTLKWVVKEMERRYDLFADSGSRDIKTYNQKVTRSEAMEEEGNYEFLPQIVVIIDELADLMMVAPADVEDSICRLAQLARAAGIHLVIATQRPSVDVITGLIKANIPSRIAFAVASATDSRTILDMGGAEKLLGNGDMLYYPRGLAKPLRVQGVYVTDEEIERVVAYVKKQADPVYNNHVEEEISSLVPEGSGGADDGASKKQDEMLEEACEFFIESGSASISMLQRHFRIGYTRAARIIDELEALGFVGPYEGSKPRKIKIGLDQCHAYFSGDQAASSEDAPYID
jgi:S-DNA-T family DNA segregation ATPase FtsK/SpoIIIE